MVDKAAPPAWSDIELGSAAPRSVFDRFRLDMPTHFYHPLHGQRSEVVWTASADPQLSGTACRAGGADAFPLIIQLYQPNPRDPGCNGWRQSFTRKPSRNSAVRFRRQFFSLPTGWMSRFDRSLPIQWTSSMPMTVSTPPYALRSPAARLWLWVVCCLYHGASLFGDVPHRLVTPPICCRPAAQSLIWKPAPAAPGCCAAVVVAFRAGWLQMIFSNPRWWTGLPGVSQEAAFGAPFASYSLAGQLVVQGSELLFGVEGLAYSPTCGAALPLWRLIAAPPAAGIASRHSFRQGEGLHKYWQTAPPAPKITFWLLGGCENTFGRCLRCPLFLAGLTVLSDAWRLNLLALEDAWRSAGDCPGGSARSCSAQLP
jgi:hypothetical protein